MRELGWVIGFTFLQFYLEILTSYKLHFEDVFRTRLRGLFGRGERHLCPRQSTWPGTQAVTAGSKWITPSTYQSSTDLSDRVSSAKQSSPISRL